MATNVRQLLTLLLCVVVVGCSHPVLISPLTHDDIRFDNNGGYSHAGRRLVLHLDGSYTDTDYTDMVGGEHVKTGRYIFTAERTHVILMPEKGVTEDLFRVDHEAVQYWVAAADRERLPKPDELRLRQISLRFILDGGPE